MRRAIIKRARAAREQRAEVERREREEREEAAAQYRRARQRAEERGCARGRFNIAGFLSAHSEVVREQRAAAAGEREAAEEPANRDGESTRRSRAGELAAQPSGDGEG